MKVRIISGAVLAAIGGAIGFIAPNNFAVVVTSFIVSTGQGLGLGHMIGMYAGAALTVVSVVLYVRELFLAEAPAAE